MKGLYKAIGIGVVSLPLIFGGCGKNDATPEQVQQYTRLQGTAFNERYTPGNFLNDSRYSFSIDTEVDRKLVQVKSTLYIRKEGIDILIEPGTKIEIEIEKGRENQQVYTLSADKIKILK